MRTTKIMLEERADYLSKYLKKDVCIMNYNGCKNLLIGGSHITAGTNTYIYEYMYAMLQACWILKDNELNK